LKGSLALNRNGFDVSPDDPMHSYEDIMAQVNGGLMNGFVSNAVDNGHLPENPISMFDKKAAPIINTLAEEVLSVCILTSESFVYLFVL
jgi:phospholipase C